MNEFMKEFKEATWKDWVLVILLTGMGFVSGMLISTDNIQDECNQHVIDNYFTEEMQLCLLKMDKNFTIPFESIGDYNLPELYKEE